MGQIIAGIILIAFVLFLAKRIRDKKQSGSGGGSRDGGNIKRK